MNDVTEWLGSLIGADGLVKILLGFLPGSALLIMFYTAYKYLKDFFDLFVSAKKGSLAAARAAADLATRFTWARALLTALAVVALFFWVVGVDAVTRLTFYVLTLMQEEGWQWDITKLNLAGLEVGVRWREYEYVTAYVIPIAVIALLLLAVNMKGWGGAIGRVALFVFGAVAFGLFAPLSLLVLVGLPRYAQTNTESIIVGVALAVGLGVYIVTLFWVHLVVEKVRELWGFSA